MNERASLRKNLHLTQDTAAKLAGVSVATWRRWEHEPSSVAVDSAASCERVLYRRPQEHSDADFERAWDGYSQITPRQAYAIAAVLDLWADELATWIGSSHGEPLHQIGPLASFDSRVMFYVGENLAFAGVVRDRCSAVAREIEEGVLPHMRPGRFIDEVLIGAALPSAHAHLDEMPELFERISPRVVDDDEQVGDEDWDVLSDWIDDESYAADWEVPLGLPTLPTLLEHRHPFTWFDLDREPPSFSLVRGAAPMNVD
ncbi:helix-turn-helix transcriptional regulator [Microbacterium maritypicum]|uniref:helix-turn-helix domain-containing protein n=1 Tax=Microbacterium maritypicum TaxID=33918 RepID=UPI003D6F3887